MAWQRTEVLKVRNVDVGGVRTSYQFCVIQVDTASDLPALNQTDWVFEIGSLAYVIDTGSKYKIKSDGTWVLQEPGSAAYTKAEVDALIQDAEDYADSAVTTGINALDASTVGGSGKYISSIYETDGIIHATPSTIQTSVNTSSNAVSSNAVKTYVDTKVATKASITDIYGPGIIIPDGADLNADTYKMPGVYYRKSTSTTEYIENTPVTSNYFKIIVEWIYPDYRLRQTFVSLNRSGAYYMRVCDSGGWQAWHVFKNAEDILLGVFGVTDATIVTTSGWSCDTALTPGIYLAQNTTYAERAVGRPNYANSGAKIWRLEVKLLNSARVYQEMIVYRIGTYEGDFDRYQRIRHTEGNWNDWQHIETTSAGTYYPSP